MTDEIVIKYRDPGKAAWTGKNIESLTLNGVEIQRAYNFELYVSPMSISHVKLDIMLGKVTINPVDKVIKAELHPGWGRVEAKAQNLLRRLQRGDELYDDDFVGLYEDVMDAVHGDEWHKY